MAVTELASLPYFEGRKHIEGFENEDFTHMVLREINLQNVRYIYVLIFKISIFFK